MFVGYVFSLLLLLLLLTVLQVVLFIHLFERARERNLSACHVWTRETVRDGKFYDCHPFWYYCDILACVCVYMCCVWMDGMCSLKCLSNNWKIYDKTWWAWWFFFATVGIAMTATLLPYHLSCQYVIVSLLSSASCHSFLFVRFDRFERKRAREREGKRGGNVLFPVFPPFLSPIWFDFLFIFLFSTRHSISFDDFGRRECSLHGYINNVSCIEVFCPWYDMICSFFP